MKITGVIRFSFFAFALVLSSAAAVSGSAVAAGFRVPDMSIAGMGSGNAMVANPEEIGAMPYNPAAMAFHDGISATGGGVLFWTYMDVTNAAGTHGIDVSRPGGPAPAVYVSWRFADQWAAGLAINSPFGQQTNWRAGTFPGFAAFGPVVAGLEPARSKIEMVNFNPNVSYRVTPQGAPLELAIAAGVDYFHVMKAQLDTQAIGLNGDGNGVGWNLAGLARYGRWSFGLSHRSSVGVDINGDITVAGVTSPASTNVRFPAITQAGVRLKVSDELALEFDVEHTRWTNFDRTVVNHGNPLLPTPIVSINDWTNAWTFRIGGDYKVMPKTTLRAGYAYDRSPLNPTHFSARLADNNRNIFMLGASQDFPWFRADIGYSYTRFNSRNYVSNTPFGTFGTDPNGTTLYNGNYKSHAHALGIGVTKQF